MAANNPFGFISDNDITESSAPIKFGLNSGVLKSIVYLEEDTFKAVDIIVSVQGKDVRRRIFDIGKVYAGSEVLEEGAPGYPEAHAKAMQQVLATLIHFIKATGVTEETMKTMLQTNKPETFTAWVSLMLGLIPNATEMNIPVDIFFEYQWTIGAKNTKTFTEIPKKMVGGKFITPTVPVTGEWTEQREWTDTLKDGIQVAKKGLRYVDKAGNIHPFVRSENFMSGKKANQQFDNSSQQAPEGFGTTPTSVSWNS